MIFLLHVNIKTEKKMFPEIFERKKNGARTTEKKTRTPKFGSEVLKWH
jgi:hypothetical protein